MAGIADSPGSSIQVNSLAALNSQPDANVSNVSNPGRGFDDFMNAFRTGFITADDIRKRQGIGQTDVEAQRATNVAAKTGAEQSTLDLESIRPKQRELAAQQIEGATQEQSLLNRINDPDKSISYPAREEFAQKQLETQATAVYGTPQPDLYKSTDQTPEDFDTWVVRQANSFQGSDQARAQYVNHLREKGETGEEYSKYKKAVKEAKVPLQKGTPEYNKALREHVHEALTYEQLQQINFELLKEAGVARAKAAAEAPVKAAQEQAKAAPELRKEYSALPEVHDFAKVNTAYNKLIAATDPTIDTTPIRDQAAIFSWMKILDPGSTVREGEYASVKNAAGVEDRVRNWYNRTIEGKILTPEQRKELREASVGQYQAQVQNVLPRIRQYTEQEQKAGLSPGTVVPREHRELLESRPATPPAAPPGANVGKATATPQEVAGAPTYPSLAAVPSTVRVFKTTDGKLLVNPNFKP
jgi:hypothetical protein